VVGPLLGGWITDNIAWPWIFYINIPVGLVAAGITWSIYHKRDAGPRRVPLDYVGLGLLVRWIGALQSMVDNGKELDWFNSTQIVLLAVTCVVGFLFFLAWELTETHPIVDLRLFGQRNFALATLSLSLGYGLFFGNVVLLPLWLQQYMGYTATWAGMAMAPVGVLAIVLSPWVGTSIFTTLWESRANMHHAHLAETINRSNDAATATLGQLNASGLTPEQGLAMVNRLIDQQAYTMAATDLFYLSSVLFVLMVGVVWLTKPKQGAHMGDGGAH